MDEEKGFTEENVNDFVFDLMNQALESSTALNTTEVGSAERDKESKIYDSLTKNVMAYQETLSKIESDKERLGLERYKIDEELRLKREIEEARLQVETSKANTEKATAWAKVGLAVVEVGSSIGLGILYLKANLKYGGMLGRDAKEWFKDLKKFKL